MLAIAARATAALLLCSGWGPAAALDNGLALTPPMGLSTWSAFRTKVNDSLIRQLADGMVSSGLRAAGYNYLLVDSGWEGKGCKGCLPSRSTDGRLVVDPAKFPNGLKPVSDYVHAKGLKFGLWFGHSDCAPSNDTSLVDPLQDSLGLPAGTVHYDPAIDYATLDAQLFADAGVDAIKHDNCVDVANTTAGIEANYRRYAALGNALNATGRPILYDVVLQVAHERTVPAYDFGYIWSPEVYGRKRVTAMANTWWSLPSNKYNCFSCCTTTGESIVNDSECLDPKRHAAFRGLLPMIDSQDMGTPGFSSKGHWDWGGPGGWNHIDQLAACVGKSWYGPGLTDIEQKAQVSLWAVLASPLIISLDVRGQRLTPECLALVANERVVAVHQDAAGIPGRRLANFVSAGGQLVAQAWGRPVKNGVAVVLLNRGEEAIDITATFAQLGLPTAVQVRATNVWDGTVQPNVRLNLTARQVEPHGVQFFVLEPEH